MSATVTVDITVRLTLDAETLTPEIQAALDALADVMAVQAEDGLYSAGSPDAADDDNQFVCDLVRYEIRPVAEVTP